MRPGVWFLAVLLLVSTLGEVTLASQLPYLDQDFSCVPQQQAQKYIDDFGIDTDSFGGLELCNASVDTKKLFNDLQIVEQGQFAANASNLLIKGYVPADQYYGWMKGQTRGMNRGNDVPYATAYNRWGYFTMQDGWAKLSTLGRVGVVIHEARHTAGYRHYPCNKGPYMGASLDGCDTNYAQGGSHAIEMEYYARVTVAGENFHPVYKAMARLMAMGRTNFVFNASPIQKREAVLAMDENNSPVLFDGTRKMSREGTDFVGRLKRTSFGAALFNGIQAMALDMYEITAFRPSNNDDYSYFKLLATNSVGTLKDFEEFDRNQKRYVAVVTTSNQMMTYNFPRGSWNAARPTSLNVVRTATMLPSGEQGYFLVNDNGDVHSLNGETQQLSATGKTWNAQVESVVLFNNKTLVLKKDGGIYQQNADGSESLFDDGKYHEMVNVPLYDAFEVK
ncbi:hypothetical protein [Bdellovibrio sp. HCB337]|uniref:hypothetical protein n=1 Tax=Bdellovibrio sp. HCB337 TaxID=3394358 RepID=UPI0039A44EBB